MKVKVRMRGHLAEIIGKGEISIQSEKNVKVIDVLSLLSDKYGEPFRDHLFNSKTGEINSKLIFALNGVNVSDMKSNETQIEDGSELLILAATGGG